MVRDLWPEGGGADEWLRLLSVHIGKNVKSWGHTKEHALIKLNDAALEAGFSSWDRFIMIGRFNQGIKWGNTNA